jgi:hypothetical protein
MRARQRCCRKHAADHRHSALFFSNFGTRRFFPENAETLSRSRGHTPLGRAHSNHVIIVVNGSLGPICKQRKPPLTTMMDRFAWVVVLAPIRGCGRESREEEKGRKRRGKGWARGAVCVPKPHTVCFHYLFYLQ